MTLQRLRAFQTMQSESTVKSIDSHHHFILLQKKLALVDALDNMSYILEGLLI